MLKIALEKKYITEQEFKILTYLVKKDDMCMKSEELSKFNINNSKDKSNFMSKLKNKKIPCCNLFTFLLFCILSIYHYRI